METSGTTHRTARCNNALPALSTSTPTVISHFSRCRPSVTSVVPNRSSHTIIPNFRSSSTSTSRLYYLLPQPSSLIGFKRTPDPVCQPHNRREKQKRSAHPRSETDVDAARRLNEHRPSGSPVLRLGFFPIFRPQIFRYGPLSSEGPQVRSPSRSSLQSGATVSLNISSGHHAAMQPFSHLPPPSKERKTLPSPR